MENHCSMSSVNLDKNVLLGIVKENKVKHDNLYAAAVSGYWEKATEILESKLTAVKSHVKVEPYLNIVYPENHSEDYDKAIRKLELVCSPQIVLDDREFSSYVLNQWAWRSSFLANNTQYLSGAAITGCSF